MGQARQHVPVLRLVAVFSRHEAAFTWAHEQLSRVWGPVVLTSPRFPFEQTAYYEPTMGPGLQKQFWAYEQLAAPEELPDWKLLCNRLEAACAASGNYPEQRPLNLDPGYLMLGKLVLASTKDHAHRIYLRDGIFAEVTLRYAGRQWEDHRWTFPDYRQAAYHAFLTECRRWYQQRLRAAADHSLTATDSDKDGEH